MLKQILLIILFSCMPIYFIITYYTINKKAREITKFAIKEFKFNCLDCYRDNIVDFETYRRMTRWFNSRTDRIIVKQDGFIQITKVVNQKCKGFCPTCQKKTWQEYSGKRLENEIAIAKKLFIEFIIRVFPVLIIIYLAFFAVEKLM